MTLRLWFLCLALMTTPTFARWSDAEADIRNVLTTQAEAWNRGDIAGFVASYAEDCTFVGTQVLHGRADLLARYQKAYPSQAAMGKLTFENLAVRQLDERIAIATGEWHVERISSSGGPIGGVFSLVLQTHGGTWQIVLDHTT
ncbi:MAG: nuclear transport factor 2 family protein [Bryobacteraceae bacterium]